MAEWMTVLGALPCSTSAPATGARAASADPRGGTASAAIFDGTNRADLHRRRLVLGLAGLLTVALAAWPGSAEAGWKKVFQDTGKKGEVTASWHLWGTPNSESDPALPRDGYTITRGPRGMRVTSGPNPSSNSHRVVLWALARVGTADVRVAYNYTRHDGVAPTNPATGAPVGIASFLLLSARGGVTPLVPPDPVDVRVDAPSLPFVNGNLDAMRLTYSTAYNPNPALRAQLRAHLLPGDVDLLPDSPNDFPFTPGITYHVLWEKVADTITVEVTPSGGVPLTWSWQDERIATKDGARVAIYQQPYRDATYANFMVWERNPD